MPATPDRHPGEEDEEGSVYENLTPGNDPPALGGVRMVDGAFRMRDAQGVFDPRTLSDTEYSALISGFAGISSGPWALNLTSAYLECTPIPFSTQAIWWTDNTKTKKILQELILAGGAIFPTQIQWSLYAADGTTVIRQAVDVIVYSGAFEINRTRTVT
jgi:hypothetical protein